jgi:hypothetical protein
MQPKGSGSLLPAAGAVGAIHLSCPLTGRLIAKLQAPQQAESADAESELQQRLLVQQQQQQGGLLGKAAAAGELSARAALAGMCCYRLQAVSQAPCRADLFNLSACATFGMVCLLELCEVAYVCTAVVSQVCAADVAYLQHTQRPCKLCSLYYRRTVCTCVV